jgi:hypothetical protein
MSYVLVNPIEEVAVEKNILLSYDHVEIVESLYLHLLNGSS